MRLPVILGRGTVRLGRRGSGFRRRRGRGSELGSLRKAQQAKTASEKLTWRLYLDTP